MEARRKASAKYDSKVSKVTLRMDKDTKDRLTDKAKDTGKSINAYIMDLIYDAIHK